MTSSDITLEAVGSVSQVPQAEWDACATGRAVAGEVLAGDLANLDTLSSTANSSSKAPYNPFVSHNFLSAIEKSNSACARTGWGPRHLLAKQDGRIVGIVPCYLKSHSQGEYVFDRGWADAYERAGGDYYPKLQASVPFTPATGHAATPRWWARSAAPAAW